MCGLLLADQQSDFYQNPIFNQILLSVQKKPEQFSIKEKQTRNGLRLLLVLDQIHSVEKLLQRLNSLEES